MLEIESGNLSLFVETFYRKQRRDTHLCLYMLLEHCVFACRQHIHCDAMSKQRGTLYILNNCTVINIRTVIFSYGPVDKVVLEVSLLFYPQAQGSVYFKIKMLLCKAIRC